MVARSAHYKKQQGVIRNYLAEQQTMPMPAVSNTLPAEEEPLPPVEKPPKMNGVRFVALGLVIILAMALYFTWRSSPEEPTTPVIAQQNNFSPLKADTGMSTPVSSNTIQVYIVGAVKRPGVYTLNVKARVFELLDAAGGPLPDANLVALNLAATLNDGQEVYVTKIGEVPPVYVGGVPAPGNSINSQTGQPGLVNINTATADELRQTLHVSSTTANAIINYRTQHGPYTSVEQLLQVISKAIYDRIKGMVTI